MTNEFKKLIFSQEIYNIFEKYNWEINHDPKKNFHSYFTGEIADYYLNIYDDNEKVYFHFTLDMEIPQSKFDELLLLINFANQNSQEGFFVVDSSIRKIKYNLIVSYSSINEEKTFYVILKTKLDLTGILFRNFVSGVHNLVYGEKFEGPSLDLLFMNNDGCA